MIEVVNKSDGEVTITNTTQVNIKSHVEPYFFDIDGHRIPMAAYTSDPGVVPLANGPEWKYFYMVGKTIENASFLLTIFKNTK